ncbi:Nuclear hormone receptor family member nhr-44 [Caenorhabditis elegans]|uniref:Nuclear hormone receptor family member nhr-44 n=1 Tax=Caenorhabditis elegans TaxID=6239 RepID=NHR44_CAEEL|nr:Nuclear hormone receptor family member nhr-44 [Caenorhabditis elegans]Q22555.2 RecName: Full=Nuclear hormone receptor family member nhr-44 [Caenorhabditis elegans]CCD72156.1 Nuclear hormone receptor family member nhr-44 [Caenorhabditis elegans]|eukprot:NP_505313.1 Nuclear hormone receptor family member nhr-44 [Caenorhabditis elegans]
MDSISSPSTSSSASSTPKLISEKCLVCFQPSHGNHFGVDSCRACAAFFRRVFVTHKQQFPCREGDNKCTPDEWGRWSCKRCRSDKCFALGMKPDNIQRDRDRFIFSDNFRDDRKRKTSESIVPLSVERFVGKQLVTTYTSTGSGKNIEYITFFDLTPIIKDADYILKRIPKLEKSVKVKSSLEQLAFGLQEVRKEQLFESVPELRKIGKMETWDNWVKGMRRAGEWIMHFEEFRQLEQEEKMVILKCMWHLFIRLERISMTAEMRRMKLCDDKEFIYGTEQRINYDTLEIDRDWFSEATDREVRSFIGPLPRWFCETIIDALMELRPSDVELSFMLCNLCFHLTGQKLGGRIQEITDRLQDVLANDLHKYYLAKDKYSRYSYRLTKLLSLNRQYKNDLEIRRQGIFLANTLNIFRVKLSHPEMFQFSC